MDKPFNDHGTGLPQEVVEALAGTLLPSLHEYFGHGAEQKAQEPKIA